MEGRNWLITGISSGFGLEISRQVLAQGDTVFGILRNEKKIESLAEAYPETLRWRRADVTDSAGVRRAVEEAFTELGEIHVLVSNAGYGLYGAAEEISLEEARLLLETNLMGSIAFLHAALPYLRRQNHGRILQVSSVAGQVGYLGNALYNASKFGITGYCEALALELEPFHVGVTIVEPGGARTDFRYGGAKVAEHLIPAYEHAHGFLDMLNPEKGLAPGDPRKMAERMIESTRISPAPRHLALGSKALGEILRELETRLQGYRDQVKPAASTDCED